MTTEALRDIIDLDRYPLDRPGSPVWAGLVNRCQDELAEAGMFNLPDFLRPAATETAVWQIRPVLDAAAFTHRRTHNIYFKPQIDGLDADHPALRLKETVNHTVCADQIPDSIVVRLYEWPCFAEFLAAVMDKPILYPMADKLARVNVMAYRAGEALNWHFDRSEFTTTLLLQAPEIGGAFKYCKDLRSEDDANYQGVARLLEGDDSDVQTISLAPGTLNVFKGRNTAHRTTPVQGGHERIIAVFSFFEQASVMFSEEERLGFYGRAN